MRKTPRRHVIEELVKAGYNNKTVYKIGRGIFKYTSAQIDYALQNIRRAKDATTKSDI